MSAATEGHSRPTRQAAQRLAPIRRGGNSMPTTAHHDCGRSHHNVRLAGSSTPAAAHTSCSHSTPNRGALTACAQPRHNVRILPAAPHPSRTCPTSRRISIGGPR